MFQSRDSEIVPDPSHSPKGDHKVFARDFREIQESRIFLRFEGLVRILHRRIILAVVRNSSRASVKLDKAYHWEL